MTTFFRKLTLALTGVGLIAIFSGCEPEKPALHPVAKMAPFDLNCPQEYIRYFPLNEMTYGVQGCGRQARYVKLCRITSQLGNEECQWLMN